MAEKKSPTCQSGAESDCDNSDGIKYTKNSPTDQEDSGLETAEVPDLPSFLERRLKEAALGYAGHGWAVLPLHSASNGRCSCGKSDCKSPGKHPRTTNGFKDATTNEIDIRKWWTKSPDANIGVVTGVDSGIIVLDIDRRNGGIESLARLEKEHGFLPETHKVLTGDGFHFYFKHPGGQIHCRANIQPGIDLRADGGYVVAPPSVHPNGRAYAWSGDTAAGFADAPDWVLTLISSDVKGKPLEHWHGILTKQIANGRRNTTLASIAGKLFFHDVNAVLVHDILGCINEARCETPLLAAEIETIVISVGKAHLQGRGP